MKMQSRIVVIFAVCAIALSFWSCKSLQKDVSEFNLFPVSDDVTLGKQVVKEIDSKPKEYPLLPEQGNEQIYAYIRGITKKILNTGQVEYKSSFPWQVKIIKDDKTLNAFCTPGGYIYVYSGLIKYLDSEDQLAGVMGHEMAHAARRHSTRQLTTMYGITAIQNILLALDNSGKYQQTKEQIAQMAVALVGLKFSRNHETEADTYSVNYLCGTEYNAAGAAGFFQKIKGQPTPPQFLSTHPDPGNRIQNIKQKAIGCKGRATNKEEYQKMKALLK